jgi:hypothetical protein
LVGQCHLDAIGAELPVGKCRAGVVDENVDARHLAAHVHSQAANCCLGRQVGEKEHRRRTCRNPRDALQRCVAARRFPAHHHNLGAELGEPLRHGEPDAAARTGDEHDLGLHA